MRLAAIVGLAAAIGCNAALAQTAGTASASGQDQVLSAITEIACPRGTQILVLLQSSGAPAYVAVDEIPAAGQGDARRLGAETVAPGDMPNTLELTDLVGEQDVFVSVRDRAPDVNYPKDFQSGLQGYIGCGGWQARILASQPNAFLLKRTAAAQPAPEAAAAPAPNSAPAEPNAVPPAVPNAPPAPASRRNDQRPARGGAQDERAGEASNVQRIASELKTLGLLGIWAHSCERSTSARDIFVDRSGRSFWRVHVLDAPLDRFTREIIDFQRLSANRFQVTSRGRFASEENANVTARYRMENNLLFAEEIRSASGHVTVERGRLASGHFRGEAVRGLVKCRGPRVAAAETR
jgi:hypothetical protein